MAGKKIGYRFALIGFPWDMGASLGRPGARYAPKSVRDALKWFFNRVKDGKVFDVETGRLADLTRVVVEDVGDVEVFAHDTLKTFDAAYRVVKNVIDRGFKPIVIGGDHSVTYPCVKALHDSAAGKLGIVQFDAHLDLVDETPHQGRYSHSSEIRRALELERVEKVVQIGVRGYNYPFHYHDVKNFNIVQLTPGDIHRLGTSSAVETVLRELEGVSHVYITVDIDVLDPAFAPGCGANEPGGLTPWELMEILKRLAPYADAFDVVEVNPLFDPNGVTASIAAKLVFDFIVYSSNPLD
ncbi:MAG: arginase family protein [Thermoprotei archaeon]|nr:MAG: arginase family protein [Thermoprotei archaeon]